jgi:hypothetical protein
VHLARVLAGRCHRTAPLGTAHGRGALWPGIASSAIHVIDRFALQYLPPNGKSVLDQFLASWPDLDAADRKLLCGWRELGEGIFEVRRRDRDSLILLNLVDDLECRAYSNMGPAVFRPLPRHGFVYAPPGSRPPGP